MIKILFHLIKTDPNRLSDKAWDALPHALQLLYNNPPKAKIDQTLEDRQELPYFGGIEVIHTPGHTPGHISLYVKRSKMLVAEDAMICSEGILKRSNFANNARYEHCTPLVAKILEL